MERAGLFVATMLGTLRHCGSPIDGPDGLEAAQGCSAGNRHHHDGRNRNHYLGNSRLHAQTTSPCSAPGVPRWSLLCGSRVLMNTKTDRTLGSVGCTTRSA